MHLQCASCGHLWLDFMKGKVSEFMTTYFTYDISVLLTAKPTSILSDKAILKADWTIECRKKATLYKKISKVNFEAI